MINDIILLKLGEIVLKGLNRRSFEQKLIGNINRNYIDFNLKEANKRDGLRRLLKVTGWQPEETLFIGDDQNDLPAVKYFHGYTVETAEPFMKEAATKVYSSVGDMLLAHL